MDTPLDRPPSRGTAPPTTPAASSDSPPLYKRRALEALVNDHGLDKHDVLAISKLGVTTARKLFNVMLKEDFAGLKSLLDPIEGVDERQLGIWLDDVIPRNKGPDPAPLPPLPPIDSTTATPVHLHPQLTPTTVHSTSTPLTTAFSQSPSAESSKSSKRKKPEPENPRAWRYCPVPNCGHKCKYSLEKHLKDHLPDLFYRLFVAETDLLGCGFCRVLDQDAEEGVAFLGFTCLIKHIFDKHSSSPPEHPWSFNTLFNNLLLGESNLRKLFRQFITRKDAEFRKEQNPYKGRPMYSWDHSTETRDLLGKLQTLGGRLNGVPVTHETDRIRADRIKGAQLLVEAFRYAGVNQKTPLPPPNPPPIYVEPIQQEPGERQEFVHMGGGAYDPPQHPPAPVSPNNAAIVRPQNAYPAQNNQPQARPPLHGDTSNQLPLRGYPAQLYTHASPTATALQAQPAGYNMPPPPVPIQEMPPFQGDNFIAADDLVELYRRNQGLF